MKRGWKILLGLSLVLGVCVVAAIWLYREGPGWNQSITLADGSVLRFRGVWEWADDTRSGGGWIFCDSFLLKRFPTRRYTFLRSPECTWFCLRTGTK
jgi:hypothetical protein